MVDNQTILIVLLYVVLASTFIWLSVKMIIQPLETDIVNMQNQLKQMEDYMHKMAHNINNNIAQSDGVLREVLDKINGKN